MLGRTPTKYLMVADPREDPQSKVHPRRRRLRQQLSSEPYAWEMNEWAYHKLGGH